MSRFVSILTVFGALAFFMPARAGAAHIDGIITGFSSGNKGSDLLVRTHDGKTHDLWFDNIRKPLFDGRELPWCPNWPCAGWPKALALNHNHVRIYLAPVQAPSLNGKTIQSPTEIVILH
jgi:hypothetical protein